MLVKREQLFQNIAIRLFHEELLNESAFEESNDLMGNVVEVLRHELDDFSIVKGQPLEQHEALTEQMFGNSLNGEK